MKSRKLFESNKIVKVSFTIAPETYAVMNSVCDEFQCNAGHYLDLLVAHDKHLTPREYLTAELKTTEKKTKNRRNSEPDHMVNISVTITAETDARMNSVCEKFQCNAGQYVDLLVACNQHLTPRECLAGEHNIMRILLEESADPSHYSGD